MFYRPNLLDEPQKYVLFAGSHNYLCYLFLNLERRQHKYYRSHKDMTT